MARRPLKETVNQCAAPGSDATSRWGGGTDCDRLPKTKAHRFDLDDAETEGDDQSSPCTACVPVHGTAAPMSTVSSDEPAGGRSPVLCRQGIGDEAKRRETCQHHATIYANPGVEHSPERVVRSIITAQNAMGAGHGRDNGGRLLRSPLWVGSMAQFHQSQRHRDDVPDFCGHWRAHW